MKKIELLAPAGNMERFDAALRYGADAVYLGLTAMSLRNYADNFGPEELKLACQKAHALDKKVYVTLNAFARDEDLEKLPALLDTVREGGADAVIVNDPGVIRMTKRLAPELPLHLSTQANTLNSEACLFYHDLGVSRIVLARELSLSQIAKLREKLPESLELEMFVHGAMCVSYSGRCLLSNYIANRDAFRGECAQPCRWSYEIREKGKDMLPFGIEEEEGKGSFLLNARDLNLLAHLKEVIDAGIVSLKIEGRMKSLAYVATVVNAYRMGLDCVLKGEAIPERVKEELNYASHRPYFTGFAFGDPGPMGQSSADNQYVTDYDIAAVVENYDPEKQLARIVQRNRFFTGDELSILSPGDIERTLRVEEIRNADMEIVESAPHPKEMLFIRCKEPVKKDDILRIRK